MHPDEKQNYIREEHSYPLVVGLTPHIDVVHIEQVKIKILQINIIIQKIQRLLGRPYTNCNQSKYYSEERCLYRKKL